MNNRNPLSKTGFFRKGDLILITVILLTAVLLLSARPFQKPGTSVTVTVDGNVYGNWPLSKDTEITIPGTSGVNHLQISGNTASIISADCPDKLCVRHTPISNSGERIVCLPNRVIVSIDAEPNPLHPDAVSQ